MRPALYASIAGLLALLAGVGVREAASFQSANELRERDAAREQLERTVEAFQDRILYQTRLWLVELRTVEGLRGPSVAMRQQVPWFDAFYVWEGNEMAYPADPPVEDLEALRKDPCIAAAGKVAAGPDKVAGGAAYMACRGGSPAVALFAGSEAAELFFSADRTDLVQRSIRALHPYPSLSLGDAAAAGVSPRRALVLRLDLLRAAMLQGEDEWAEFNYALTALDILRLDAPTLNQVIDLYRYPVATDLRKLRGLTPDEDDEELARALRRIAAWREIHDRNWTGADIPSIDAGPRLLVDPYGETPWVVLYAKLGMGDVIGGVQIDQRALVDTFIGGLKAEVRDAVSVVDANDRVIAGSAEPLFVHTNFDSILPHLRVGLTRSLLPDSGSRRRLFLQLVPVGLGVLVGTVALLAMIRSDRQQLQLLERQREFMARVTHELKTPLAGMRLMAENLEMGAWDEREQVSSFAARIMGEADRLAARVDEIIRAASGPAREDPTEFDVDALIAEVAERWRPLVEQQGGSLVVAETRAGLARARRGLVRDALVNLVDNALKYRNPARPLLVELKAVGDRRTIWFEVIDNGMGVPPHLRKVIFERFRRVEGPGRGKSGGHGLGLSFVADAVQAHGGRVECRESASGGARFILRIRRRS